MAPVIVSLSPGIFRSPGSLPWPLCVYKSHDLYHARESPLNLMLFWSKLRAMLPEPGETVRYYIVVFCPIQHILEALPGPHMCVMPHAAPCQCVCPHCAWGRPCGADVRN